MHSLLRTVSTGFHHNDKPVIPEELDSTTYFEESVKETIDTGFGDKGELHKQCPSPYYTQYLEKGNHLSEFKTETDKELARQNLGVYSKDKINQLLDSITSNVGNLYVTKVEVNQMIDNIKFVDSTLKAYANYVIPTNLFRL